MRKLTRRVIKALIVQVAVRVLIPPAMSTAMLTPLRLD